VLALHWVRISIASSEWRFDACDEPPPDDRKIWYPAGFKPSARSGDLTPGRCLGGEHQDLWGVRRQAGREAIIWPDETTAEAPAPEEDPAADANAILQVKFWLTGISSIVWRRVLVPANCTLRELHGVIQVAMGWGQANSR
jgi:hypothetical protein